MDNNLREFLKLTYRALGKDRRDKIAELKLAFEEGTKTVPIDSITYIGVLELFEKMKVGYEKEIADFQKRFNVLEDYTKPLTGISTPEQFDKYINSI